MTGRLGALVLVVVAAASVYDPAARAAQPKLVALLCVTVLLLSIGLLGRERVFLSPALVSLFGLAALAGFGAAWGPSGGVERAACLGVAVGLAVATRALAPRKARLVACGYAAGLGAVAGVSAVVQGALGARGVALHGGMGNANWLGVVLAAVVLPTVSLAFERGVPRGVRFVAVGVVGVESVAVVVAGSRVAWVALAVGAVTWLLSRRRPTVPWPAMVLVLALTLGMVAAALGAAPHVAARDDGAALTALAGRLGIWRAALDAALDAFPFGSGAGSFGHVFLDAQAGRLAELDVALAARTFENAATAHCDVLHVAVEHGFFGVVLLVASLTFGATGLASSWPAGASAIVVIAVSGVGDDALSLVAVAAMFGLLLAVGERAAPQGPRALAGGVPRAPSLVVCALAVGLLARAALAGWLGTRALHAAEGADPTDRHRKLVSATRLDPRSGDAAFALGVECARLGDLECARTELERSRGLLANVGTDIALGNVALRAGDREAAVRAYRRAVALHPGSFAGHVALAAALVEHGQDVEGARHAELARRVYPGHPKLTQLDERIGRARARRESGGD